MANIQTNEQREKREAAERSLGSEPPLKREFKTNLSQGLTF